MGERTTVEFDGDNWAWICRVRGESLVKRGEELSIKKLVNELLREAIAARGKR